MTKWEPPAQVEGQLDLLAQPDPRVLDAGESARRRDEAIERVDRGVDDDWRAEADAVIARLAESGEPFTSDDVWACGLAPVRENRALGARIRAAQRAGLIVPTGDFVLTTQVSSHRSPARVWRGTRA